MIALGKNLMVYIPSDDVNGGTAGDLNPIACDQSCQIAGQFDMLETTVKDNGFFKTFLPSMGSYQIQGNGLIDFCNVINSVILQTYMNARTPIAWKMMFTADSPDSGTIVWSGTGYFQQVQQVGAVGSALQYSYTIQVTGKPEISNSFSCGTGGGGSTPITDMKETYRLQFIATDGQKTYQSDDLIGATLLWLTIANEDLYKGDGDYQFTSLNSTTGTITWNYATNNGNECIVLYKK
jgi:hypothetical protein